MLPGAPALLRRIVGLSPGLSRSRRSGAADRGGAAGALRLRLCGRRLYLCVRHREPGRDAAPAGLHKQGYFGTLKTDPNGSFRRLVAGFISKEDKVRLDPSNRPKSVALPEVRIWHIADMPLALTNVRFWGLSGH